jgi:hypothetical protein
MTIKEQTMKKGTLRQLSIIIAILAMIAVNVLANALPLNGQNTGEISDRFAILFVPAGYVFAIWGLIYLLLLAYTVYQALPAQRDNPRLKRVAPWVLLGAAANITWIFTWHYNLFTLTLPVMLVLLLSLVFTYLGLRRGSEKVTAGERYLVRLPFSVYLGWISVATIANASQLLFFLGWDGLGIAPAAWAVVMLAAALVVGALMAIYRADLAYLGVLVWAVIGIALKQAAVLPVSITAWVTVALLVVLMVVAILRRKTVFARGG